MLRHVDEFVLRAHSWLGSLRRERGQTLAEYGLVLTLVAVGVVVPTMLLFRAELAGAFDSAVNCLNGSC